MKTFKPSPNYESLLIQAHALNTHATAVVAMNKHWQTIANALQDQLVSMDAAAISAERCTNAKLTERIEELESRLAMREAQLDELGE